MKRLAVAILVVAVFVASGVSVRPAVANEPGSLIPAHEDVPSDPPIHVTYGGVRLVPLPSDAATIIVSDPTVVDVQLESPRVLMMLGLAAGETQIIILNGKGGKVINARVIVQPPTDRYVSVTRGCVGACQNVEEELNCAPRCMRVATPGVDARAPAAAPSDPAAPAAPGAPGAPAGAGEAMDAAGVPPASN